MPDYTDVWQRQAPIAAWRDAGDRVQSFLGSPGGIRRFNFVALATGPMFA
jgi:hypothetical protein